MSDELLLHYIAWNSSLQGYFSNFVDRHKRSCYNE